MTVNTTAVGTSQTLGLATLAARLAEASTAPSTPEPVLAGFVARHWGKASAARLTHLPSGLEPDEAAGLAAALAAALRETTSPHTPATFRPENILLQPALVGWEVILAPPAAESGAALTGKTSLIAFAGLLYRLAVGQKFASDQSGQKVQLSQLRNYNPYLATLLENALTGGFSSPGALAGGFGWSLYRKTYLNFPALLVTKKRSFRGQSNRSKPARTVEQLPAETTDKPASTRTLGGPLALVSLLVAMVLLAGTVAFSVGGLDNEYQQQSQVAPTRTTAPTVAPTPSPAVALQVSRLADGASLTRYNPALDQSTGEQYTDPAKLATGQVAALNDFNSLQIQNARWSDDGKKIDLALKDGGWETWDTVTKQRLARKELPNTEQYQTVSWSPNGQNFVAVGLDGQMRLGKADRVSRTVTLGETNSPYGRFSTYPWPFSWSPDSTYVLVAVPNSNLQLWSFQNIPTQIEPPQNSRGAVMSMRGNNLSGSIAWSGDSRYLARLLPGELNQQVQIYNPRNLARLYTMDIIDTPGGVNNPQTGQNTGLETVGTPGLVWSPDGRYIAIIRTFNLGKSGTATNYLSGPGGDLVSLLEVPVLSNSRNSGQSSQLTPNAQRTPTSQATPRGNLSGTTAISNLSPVHLETLTLPGLDDEFTAGGRNLVWSKNNRLLVMGTNSLTSSSSQNISYKALTLDLNTDGGNWHWQIGNMFDLPFEAPHNYVDWSPDNRQILFNTSDNLLGIGVLPDQVGKPLTTEILHKARSSYNNNYLPSPDGRSFLQVQARGKNSVLTIRDSTSGEVQSQLAAPEGVFVYPTNKGYWSPNGRVLAIPFTIQTNASVGTPQVEQIIRAWRFEPDKAPALLGDLLVIPSKANYVDFSNNIAWDGKDNELTLLFETDNNQVGRWYVSKPLPSLVEQRQVVERQVSQPDAPVKTTPYFQVFGQILGKVSNGGNGIWAWLPDHKHLIYCSLNCYIQELLAPGATYSAEQALGIRFDPAPLGAVNSSLANGDARLAVSPDGRMVALALPGGLVNLYDAATGKLFNSFTAHQGPIYSLSFSPDGHFLVTNGLDRAVKVWDTTAWRPQAVLRLVTTNSITAQVQWLPDNKTLSVGNMLFWRALP